MSVVNIVVFSVVANFIGGKAFAATIQSRENNNRLAAAMMKQRIPGKCSNSASYDCGEKCIPLTKWRDGVADCADKSDEECWPGMVKCPGTNTCVEESDQNLCVSKADNKICKLSEAFMCSNGNCVLNNSVNDSKNDCGDWSDEPHLLSSTVKH